MVICGLCNAEFETLELEHEHVCSATGVKPTDPLTMGANYEAIQQAALARGAEESQAQDTPEEPQAEGTPEAIVIN